MHLSRIVRLVCVHSCVKALDYFAWFTRFVLLTLSGPKHVLHACGGWHVHRTSLIFEPHPR